MVSSRLACIVAVGAVLATMGSVSRASDIPGEVFPGCPDVGGPPLCTTPMRLSLAAGLGSLSVDDTPFGDRLDPWVVTQSLNSMNADIEFAGTFQPVSEDLVFSRNPTNSGHEYGRYFSLAITNNTGQRWFGFEFELQTELGMPSSDDDGDSISFGQRQINPFLLYRNPTSDAFTLARFDYSDRDAITFGNGVVEPGDTVNFSFIISEREPPSGQFFLRESALSQVPEPSSLVLCGFALLCLAGKRRISRAYRMSRDTTTRS